MNGLAGLLGAGAVSLISAGNRGSVGAEIGRASEDSSIDKNSTGLLVSIDKGINSLVSFPTTGANYLRGVDENGKPKIDSQLNNFFNNNWLGRTLGSGIDLVSGGLSMVAGVAALPARGILLGLSGSETAAADVTKSLGVALSTFGRGVFGTVHSAAETINTVRDLAGETLSAGLGVAKSVVELGAKGVAIAGVAALDAVGAIGIGAGKGGLAISRMLGKDEPDNLEWSLINTLINIYNKQNGDSKNTNIYESLGGSMGNSLLGENYKLNDPNSNDLEGLLGSVVHPFRVVADQLSGTKAVDKRIFDPKTGFVIADMGYQSNLTNEQKMDAIKKVDKEINMVNDKDLRDDLKFEDKDIKELNIHGHQENGLDSFLVKKDVVIDGVNKQVYYLSFGGTEQGEDFAHDGYQGVAFSTQYLSAVDKASKLQDKIKAYNDTPKGKAKPIELVVTGHSLGGGLSASVSKTLDIKGVTFNPAGTSIVQNIVNQFKRGDGVLGGMKNVWNSIGKTSWNNIDSYMTQTDWLTTFQTGANSSTLGLLKDAVAPIFPVRPDGRTHVLNVQSGWAVTEVKAHNMFNYYNYYGMNDLEAEKSKLDEKNKQDKKEKLEEEKKLKELNK